jgi:hypothetical protein
MADEHAIPETAREAIERVKDGLLRVRRLAFVGSFLFMPMHGMTYGVDRPARKFFSATVAHESFAAWLTSSKESAEDWYAAVEKLQKALRNIEAAEIERKEWAIVVGFLSAFSLAIVFVVIAAICLLDGHPWRAVAPGALLAAYPFAQHFGAAIIRRGLEAADRSISAATASIPGLLAGQLSGAQRERLSP